METMKSDILKGLTSKPKQLSSKYFYDEKGSEIFRDIMRMPEYYLTDCEYEIFNEQSKQIYHAFANHSEYFHLIELGSGDGLKTKVLLREFLKRKASFKYIPVDISHDSLSKLEQDLKDEFPMLQIEEKHGDYFEVLDSLKPHITTPKVILFLGSNLGNYDRTESIQFFKKIRRSMGANDKLFVGLDLKKSPRVILDAYDDPHRHTARFNLNLLTRINRELNADFDLTQFEHHAVYDPVEGAARSYIVSLSNQKVNIQDMGLAINFKAFEAIYTEQSQKYDMDMIADIAFDSGFEIITNFHDSRQYFVNTLWQPI